MKRFGMALLLAGLLAVIFTGALSADGPTATPTVTNSPSNPSGIGAATAVPTPASGGALNLSLPNPLEEAEMKLREFENEWLPLKDAMFLGGHIIGIMGPGLECLRFFAYIFYVPYLIALLRWFLRKEPWQEIFMGRSGFWLFMLIIAGAWPVYLTSMHELAYITFLPDNGTVREALGMTLTGFAPDLSPVSLKDVLIFLPLLISWHLGYEIILFTTLPLFIIWSGLARNTRPLQAWVVAYFCFVAFGIFWFVSLKAIEWYHGGPEMGLFQSNFARSMLTLVNYVFIGVSVALGALLTAIPSIHLFRVGFGGAAASAGNRLAGIDWNELVQWLVMLGLISRPQQYAPAGAWDMGPPGHPQIGPHPRMLPPPQVDTGGGGGGNRNGGSDDGGRAGTDRSKAAASGDTVDGSFRELGDDETLAPPPVDLNQWRGDTTDSMRADLAQWEIEDGKVPGAVPQVDATPARGALLRGDETRVDEPPRANAVIALPAVEPPPQGAFAEDEHTPQQDRVVLPGVDAVVDDQDAGLPALGNATVSKPQRGGTAADERKQVIMNLPSVDPAPKAEADVTEPQKPIGGVASNAAAATDAPVVKETSQAQPTVKKTYRMGTMKRDHTVDGQVLSASEPVLITEIGKDNVTTSEGYVIPRELVDFEEG